MYVQSTFQNSFEPLMRIELMTSSLPRKCSTPELQWQRAEDRARTGHLQLGRLSLYRMSYSRKQKCELSSLANSQVTELTLKLTLKWGEEDSNLRRLSQQIYSLPPLTAREPLRTKARIMDN